MGHEQDFVHLHLHTEYSLLDGAGRSKEYAARAAEWGMPSLALTDHGAMYGAVEFHNACRDAGVKPILGCEAYMVAEGTRFDRTRQGADGTKTQCHFVLLAENEIGYRNLLKLVSESWLNGFYYKPRLDHDILAQHHEGLIALSACLGGEIPQYIMNGQRDKALQTAYFYRDLFGPDNFFLELMDHHTPEQDLVNKALVELSRESGIPLVCTNDVHYLDQADADPQDLLLCIQTGCLKCDEKRMRMSSRELYLRSADEMWQLFGELPDALLRTRAIAERCNVELKFGDLILPEFPVPEGHTAPSYLRQLCQERVGRFYDPVTPDIRERIDYELKVIDDKGYSAYFLIVWDLIDYAKRHGIRVGPGRGSAAGSMVAYVLGITELDPLRYSLFFERFLNPERPSAPDIDIDFPPERREEVVAYTIEKYGPTRTAKIITFGTLGARAAIKDVGRVLQMPPTTCNELSQLVPEKPGTHLKDAMEEVDELRRRYDSDGAVREVLDAALRLEGLARHTSIHAAALVIARDEIDNYVPLCKVSGGADSVTQFDMGAIEQIGLLKMDFLGLRTMTVIDEACRLVRENHGIEDFDVRTQPLDDAKTFELISKGDVVGVFQLESGGFQRVCRDLKPDCIDDIVALVALYRPGPMENIPKYIARKHGVEPVRYQHPKLEEILSETYGIIVYQEQVMQIGRDLAGFSLGEADQIRKAVGKKNAEAMAKVRRKFTAGCAERDIDQSVAEGLMDEIEAFASYAFNKAHSACYGVVSYWTAYLKANFPNEFMAAQLTSVMDKRDKVVTLIQDTRGMGIDVLPPCVNTGGVVFETHEDHIVYGLAGINGVGVNVAQAIVDEREANGEYADLSDLCFRHEPQVLPKAAVEKLIKAGACRSFGNRQQLGEVYEAIFEAASRARSDAASGQGSLFDGFAEEDLGADVLAPQLPSIPEYDRDELRAMDCEFLGLVLYENPFADMQRKLAEVELEFTAAGDLAELEAGGQVVLAGILEECVQRTSKNGNEWMLCRLNDGKGVATLFLFSRSFDDYAHLARQGDVVLAVGKLKPDDRGGSPAVVIDRLLAPANWKRARRAAEKQAPKKKVNGRNGNGHAMTPRVEAPLLDGLAAIDVRCRVGEHLGQRLAQLADTLKAHGGDVPVVLWLEDGAERRRLKLAPDFAAAWSTNLESAVSQIEGCCANPVE